MWQALIKGAPEMTDECGPQTPAPCQAACPAGIDIPSYVTLIGMGRDAEAIDVIRRDNPFPWVCGLVCTRPCEFMCVRGRVDSPIAIKSLKAFAAERAMAGGTYRNPAPAPPKHKKVAIIGAGPAGLSAAYYLALMGYDVSIFEALPVAGGMMMVGIPRYRLPRKVIDRETAMLSELGVTFHFDTRFGKDVTLEQLKKDGYLAFLFAIGAHRSLKLGIAGEKDYSPVIDAIDILRAVALGNRQIPGRRVIIIGGGNVAIDAARTCIRLGVKDVTIAYRRTRAEMPADMEEIEQAEEEGIHMSFLTVPVEIHGENGQLTGLRCLRAKLVTRKDSDRKVPVPVEGSDYTLPADAVICAIGQCVDQTGFETMTALKWTRRNAIDVNPACMETAVPGIFAAGDAVLGPATVVEAIGGGKLAAYSMDRYLSGIEQPQKPPVPVRRRRMDFMDVPAGTKINLKRPEMPLLNPNQRRGSFQQVELGLSEKTARTEARRCLRCDVCLRCGDCVEICRDKMGIDALQLGYISVDHPVKTDFGITATRCIGCGACAENCPNGAIRISDNGDERVLSLCGTILIRLPLVHCESCGASIEPARYQDFVSRRLSGMLNRVQKRTVCGTCARKLAARRQVSEL